MPSGRCEGIHSESPPNRQSADVIVTIEKRLERLGSLKENSGRADRVGRLRNLPRHSPARADGSNIPPPNEGRCRSGKPVRLLVPGIIHLRNPILGVTSLLTHPTPDSRDRAAIDHSALTSVTDTHADP